MSSNSCCLNAKKDVLCTRQTDTYKELFNPLHTENPERGTLAYSEDPDDKLHDAAFLLACTVCYNNSNLHGLKYIIILKNSSSDPLKYINEQSHPYCIYLYGEIHQNIKG